MPPTGLATRVLRGSSAAASYPTNPYDATPVATARELHMLNRMGAGFTQTGLSQMRKAGGARKWFNEQLAPSNLGESSTASAILSWYPAATWSASTKWARDKGGAYPAWYHARDLGNISLLRRIYSNRQVLEQMVDFWSNHFNVASSHEFAWVQRKAYDDVLRKYALTTFEQLLIHASLHPAMLLYLDNYKSVKGAPNENQGRELLELHTVGRTAGYTERMVKDSAKILSGYTVDLSSWAARYDRSRHTTGRVTVLGFKAANSSTDGRAVTKAYLKYLAHHPATAKRICRKLAVRFVSDNPSDALVSHLAHVYLSSGTSVKAVLRALVASPEFWGAAGKKLRTPYDDLIATSRALAVQAKKPTGEQSFGNALNWQHGAVRVYEWPTPDGAPDVIGAWTSVSRMLNSFRFHFSLAGGYWPTQDVTYRNPASWLPESSITFDQLVDHLSRTWLGRSSTPQLLLAACEATDNVPSAVITSGHRVVGWQWPLLTSVFFDSPKHMSR